MSRGRRSPKNSLKAKVFQPMRNAGKMWLRMIPASSSLENPTKALKWKNEIRAETETSSVTR